jgi:hypothetical protein
MSPYRSRPIRRQRASKAEVEELRSAIFDIVEDNQPCSVRNVYYVGIGLLWDKDKGGDRRNYKRVVENLGVMRENGSLPFEWITDSTRYRRIPSMYNSVEEALSETAQLYRRDLWAQQPRHIEVWAESDSIAGTIDPVTSALGVGLFSCRWQASKTFCHSAAVEYLRRGKPVTVLYIGDWDPSGLSIAMSLKERLNRYSRGEVEIDFERVAVVPTDVREGGYVTHDVNPDDKNLDRFMTECQLRRLPVVAVETEAIPAPELRDRLEAELYEQAEDIETWNATIAAEQSEKEVLARMRGMLR